MIARALSAILAGALSASVVPSAHADLDAVRGGAAFTADSLRAAAADAPIIARTGDLSARPDGLPSTSEPARQLKSAVVRQDLANGRLTGTFVLNAAPSTATTADLHVSFGSLAGSTCEARVDVSTPTAGSLAEGFTQSGSTLTLSTEGIAEASYADWDCAFAALTVAGQPPAPGTAYDVLIGALDDVYGKPKLQIENVELLRSKVKRLKLVRKVWTTVDVTVKNAGGAPAPDVRVSGKGNGLKVKAAKIDGIAEGGTSSGEVRVKLTANRRRTLKLVARSGDATASRRIAVAPVPPPPRPVPGEYRSKDGSVTFRIAKGKVIGWRGYMQTRCGGFPDLPRYTMNTYDFPKTRVARNGIVDARDRGELYGAGLEMKVAGSRVTNGYFFYSGPDRCFASTRFTAKLTSR